jgi:hypothetical protein
MARPYTVDIPGGGQIVVNANSPEAARENAGIPGASVHAGSYQSSGGENYAQSEMDVYRAQNPASSTSDQAALQQLINGQNAMLKAIAEGNMDAFREAVRQFDLSFGLDRDKFSQAVSEFNQNFGLLQGGLTGVYQGQPTLAAQKQAADQAIAAAGLTGVYQGQPTMQAQQQYFTQGLQGATLAAGLQANPFRQQQVLGQLGPLLSGRPMAAFQAANTVPGVGTAGGNTQGGLGYLQQMIEDIRNPTPNQTNVNQVLEAIPTPNKLNSVDFLRAAPSTQQMILQGMQEKYGIDPADAYRQVQNTLPQFQAPTTMGTIRR